MQSTVLLQASGLTRHFGAYHAVQNINITLQKGEVLGLLGPNGAGKSTTMQMLSGNLAPTMGEIHINGVDLLEQPRQAKRYLGYLPENPPVYRDLTVYEYLNYCAQLHQIPKAEKKQAILKALQQCDLESVQTRLIANLSKGFRQRVGIAQAIVHRPAVVILDEPTVGLDPLQIQEIRHLIRELANEHAVILSTHILPEVQAVCDRVQMIYQGRTVFSESMQVLNQASQTHLLLECIQPIDVEKVKALKGVVAIQQKGASFYEIEHDEAINIAPILAALCLSQGWELKRICPLQNSLEHIFTNLVHQEVALEEGAA